MWHFMLHFSKDRGKLSLSFTSKKFLAEAIEKLDDENNTKKTFTLEYSSSCVQYPRCKMNILSKIILFCNSRYVYRSISYLFFLWYLPFFDCFSLFILNFYMVVSNNFVCIFHCKSKNNQKDRSAIFVEWWKT